MFREKVISDSDSENTRGVSEKGRRKKEDKARGREKEVQNMPGEKKADNDDVFQTMESGTFSKVLRERGKKGSGITRQRRESKNGNN